jgi:hypothetical protein
MKENGMSMNPPKRYGRPSALSILAIPGLAIAGSAALAGLGVATGALADGVVIESSSSSHAVGERVEDGGYLEVEDGAEVKVLDRTGEVRRYEGPGARYEAPSAEPEARARGRETVASRLAMSFTGLGRRAGLGTMRGGPEECLDVSGSRSAPVDCAATAASGGDAPASGWALSVRSEFSGYVSCDWAGAEQDWRRLDLGGDHGGAMIESDRLHEFFSADGATEPELEPGAELSVRCLAIDVATWSALEPQWRDDYGADEARALMEGFAAVSGGRFAEVAAAE